MHLQASDAEHDMKIHKTSKSRRPAPRAGHPGSLGAEAPAARPGTPQVRTGPRDSLTKGATRPTHHTHRGTAHSQLATAGQRYRAGGLETNCTSSGCRRAQSHTSIPI